MLWFLAILCAVCALPVFFVRFVTVREGEAVSFEFLGRYVMTCFNFMGYCANGQGYIVQAPGPDTFGSHALIMRLGGLVFYIRFFVRPVPYRERSENDGFGNGYNVHLNEMQEELSLQKAETTEQGDNAIALDVKYVVKWRIANPRLYLYVAPKDAKKQIVNRLHGIVRAWVKAGSESHAQSAKGNGVGLWNELVNPTGINASSIFNDMLDRWGFEIAVNSIVVTDIGYDPEYQAALKSKRQQELLAEGETARIYGPIKAVLPAGAVLSEENAVNLRFMTEGNFSQAQNQSRTTFDVQSAGQPINPNFAGTIATAEIIGDAIARAFGKKGAMSPGKQGGKGDKAEKEVKKDIHDLTHEEFDELQRKLGIIKQVVDETTTRPNLMGSAFFDVFL